MRRHRKLYLLALALLIAEATAQTPRVIAVTATPRADSLGVAVQLADIFSPKIVNTIRSGLPAVIRFDFRVLEAPDRELQQATRLLRIVYDVWNDRYHLQFNEQERLLASFIEVEKFCANFDAVKLVLKRRLQPQKTYQLRLQVAVIPISTKQDQQLREWLEVADDTEESTPGENRGAGFRLNISRLLSFFGGNKERPFSASAWATSPPFRVE